jgi:hypothetical protein
MSAHVLLLIGSGKRPRSTSESLGQFLLQQMQKLGWTTEALNLFRMFKKTSDPTALLEAVRRCDMLVVAFPLYVDCLPCAVIQALEALAADHPDAFGKSAPCLVAIVNSGFPEARQSDTAVAICRKFAEEAGFNWAGSLVLPGGEVINGKALSERSLMVRRVVKSLRLTAAALAKNEPVPPGAVRLMARPLVPSWLYLLFAGIGWRKMARGNGVQGRLNRRPYA